MKILLLGGTGAMGTHLASLLSERGHSIVITSRSYYKSREHVQYLQGNAKDLSFLENLFKEKWNAIIDFMIYKEDEFKDRIDLFLNSTSHYIFLSSARVYNQSNQALTEEAVRLLDSSLDEVFLATDEYSLSKARQENMLNASKNKNWTIIRPYITYSKNRLQLGTLEKENWLYRALHGRTIVFSEDMISHTTTLTYGLDVATGIASIINKKDALGEIFHITTNHACTWNDILNLYLNVLETKLGKRPKVAYQNLLDFSTWNPGVYQIIYDRLFERSFNNTKINNFVDTEKFKFVYNGLKECLDDFIENPEFLYINWKNEAIKDRFCKEKTPIKEIVGSKQKIKYLLFRYIVTPGKANINIERNIK